MFHETLAPLARGGFGTVQPISNFSVALLLSRPKHQLCSGHQSMGQGA
jgi:hypothetical protein